MTRDIFIGTLKTTIAIIAIVTIMLWWGAEINRAMAATLRFNPVVETNQIRVGDIFDGVGEHADHALAPAPKPGQSITWNTRTLMRISTAFDLGWSPNHHNEAVNIRRTGQIVPQELVEETVLSELYAKEGMQERMTLSLRDYQDIVLPDDANMQLQVVSLDYDPVSKTVGALMRANDPLIKTNYTIRGSLSRVIAVPVLRATMRKGDVIGEYDVDWIDISEHQLRPDMVIRAEDIVGMTPRRFISIGDVVRFNDLDKPKLVQRGEPVTITYNTGRIQLTAQGRALENGAKGHMIEVANKSSNRTIQAVVTGTREVSVLQ